MPLSCLGMLPVRRVVALAAVATVLGGTGADGAVHQAAPARAVSAVSVRQSRAGYLYFLRRPGGGDAQYVMRVPAYGGTPQRIWKIVNAAVYGLAVVGDRLYWLQGTPEGSIRYINLRGAPHVRVLVRDAATWPTGFLGAGGWLYWADQAGIGRVRPDGRRLTPQFLPMVDASQGLATDSHYLYFSSCSDQIGRVAVNGHGLNPSYIRLPSSACPQGLAVGNDHLYWTELGPPSYIGRATLRGTHADNRWLDLRRLPGPFDLAADNRWLFFDWETGAGLNPPTDVGRARVGGTAVHPGFLAGIGPFLLTSPGANS